MVNREKQIADAEEMLGDALQRVAFAKGLFFGRHLSDRLPEYPLHVPAEVPALVSDLRKFLRGVDRPGRDRSGC